jgi:hypothetical protein
MHCHAYGTVLRTNLPWAALTPALPSTDAVSIQVDRVLELPACGPLLTSRSLQGRTVRVLGTFPDLLLRIDDVLLVSFEQQKRRLQCFATPQASDAVIEYWLLRQMIPIAQLIWNEAEILHAGAVRIGDWAAAFLAPSCTGKSTLVGHFIGCGYQLVTDDHLVLRRGDMGGAGIRVLPTIPYYRDYRGVETLGRRTDQYNPAPCKLGAIYVLKAAPPESPVRASALSNSEAALELLHQAPYNLINLEFPTAIPLARRRFEFLSTLPLHIPVRRLNVPRSLDRLPEVSAYILSDLHRFTGTMHAKV